MEVVEILQHMDALSRLMRVPFFDVFEASYEAASVRESLFRAWMSNNQIAGIQESDKKLNELLALHEAPIRVEDFCARFVKDEIPNLRAAQIYHEQGHERFKTPNYTFLPHTERSTPTYRGPFR